jgi:indole-3-glycerol phosphate synthase
MKNILKEICKKKRSEIEDTKSRYSLKSLKKLLPEKKNRNFGELLNTSQKNKKNNIIAEIKKSSPSAGEIIKNYHPDQIALQYEKSGAGAISVLTEKNFFSGDLDHLSLINKITRVPILRKDFILDEYQIYESKFFKADSILLIVKILTDNQIRFFLEIAQDIGIDCIIETHSEEEVQRAIRINHPIIGINNRNLDTLSMDINNSLDLLKGISNDFTIIGESGIKNSSDIRLYNQSGIYNFLIGETLLKSDNIKKQLNNLLENDNTS